MRSFIWTGAYGLGDGEVGGRVLGMNTSEEDGKCIFVANIV